MRARSAEGDGRRQEGGHACKCAARREGDGQRWVVWWVGHWGMPHAGIRLKGSLFSFFYSNKLDANFFSCYAVRSLGKNNRELKPKPK